MSMLLDDLAELVQCEYLSDLRGPEVGTELSGVLLRIPAENYPAAEWADALTYLTGEHATGATAQELRQELLDRLVS